MSCCSMPLSENCNDEYLYRSSAVLEARLTPARDTERLDSYRRWKSHSDPPSSGPRLRFCFWAQPGGHSKGFCPSSPPYSPSSRQPASGKFTVCSSSQMMSIATCEAWFQLFEFENCELSIPSSTPLIPSFRSNCNDEDETLSLTYHWVLSPPTLCFLSDCARC